MDSSVPAGAADPAHAPKKMAPPSAAPMGPGAHGPARRAAPPPLKLSAIRWRSVFRWAAYVVRVAPALVALEIVMTIAGTLLTLYNLQVLATVISSLNTQPCTGDKCAGAGAASASLISHLMPSSGESAAIVFACVTVFIIFLTYATRVLTAYVDNLMVARLRLDVHDRLLTLGPSFFEKFDSGRATLLMTSFVSVAQTMLNEVATGPIIRLVSMAGALYFLFVNLNTLQQQDTTIHAIFLIGLIGLPIVGWFLSVRLRASFTRARDSQALLAEEFMNSVFRPSEIQLMGAAPQRSQAFARRVQVQAHDQVMAAARRELALDFQNAMPGLLQAVILIYGIFVATHSGNPAAAGAIFGLYAFVPQAIAPIQNVLQFAAGFTSSWPQLEAVIDVLEAEPDGGGHDGTIDIGPSDRSVTFKDVSFAYAPDRPKILDGVSHAFPAGKITAVVARFGTGKSTVLNLIARLRRPQAGAILIADKDLQQVKRVSLRQNLVKISQFPLFIADTARENFRLAKADATDAEIEAACRRTGLWDVLVKETPPGGDPLDYHVARQDDIGLTGGQRRMFAVTRALLLEPTVLLLDEPTTGVDPIGRHEIYEMLAKACAGLTVVVVDQDFNFITHFAHEVCCLEGGKFVDIGSPAELMQRPSLFQRLSQASQQ